MAETLIGGTFIRDFEELTGVNVSGLEVIKKENEEETGVDTRLGKDVIELMRIVDEYTEKSLFKSSVQINLDRVPFDMYEVLTKRFLEGYGGFGSDRVSTLKDIPSVMVHLSRTYLGDSIIFDLTGEIKSAYALQEGDRVIIGKDNVTRTEDKLVGRVATVENVDRLSENRVLKVVVEGTENDPNERKTLYLSMDEWFITERRE